MSETNKRGASTYQYPFPAIPKEWKRDEMQFAFGLRRLFDIIFSKKALTLDTVYPVGIIIIADSLPVNFGTWEEVEIGLTGTKAWKRTA